MAAATDPQLPAIWAATPADEPEVMNKSGSVIAAVAGIAVLSGVGLTHHHAATATHSISAVSSQVHSVSHGPKASTAHPAAARSSSPAGPSLGWLATAGGQAQVTLNNQVATLAADLQTENGSPTVANHLAFEADARVVRAEAQQILTTPALLPTTQRAAYQHMLNAYIVVANLLQPGPGYGTTPQDDAAWTVAMNASNINIS
jgi:hypothetical protein